MGGVINIVSGPRPRRRTAEVKTQYGNNGTPKVDYFASDRIGKLAASVDGNAFETDGFSDRRRKRARQRRPRRHILRRQHRRERDGQVQRVFRTRPDYPITDHASVFGRGGYFSEDRDNAKIGEINDTDWKFFNAGTWNQRRTASDLQAHVFGDWQRFHSTFLAVTNSTCPAASSGGRMRGGDPEFLAG